MADEAEKHGILLSFECHHMSLTETPKSAARLLRTINHKNVKTHWQQTGTKTIEENLESLKMMKPYLSGIFHAHNYRAGEGYMPLKDVKDRIKTYYEDYKNTDFRI